MFLLSFGEEANSAQVLLTLLSRPQHVNKTVPDILLREHLEEEGLIKRGTLSKITYVLSQQKDSTPHEILENSFIYGKRIDRTILCENLPKPSNTTLILLCGPGAMVENIRKHLLSEELGHKDENIQIF